MKCFLYLLIVSAISVSEPYQLLWSFFKMTVKQNNSKSTQLSWQKQKCFSYRNAQKSDISQSLSRSTAFVSCIVFPVQDRLNFPSWMFRLSQKYKLHTSRLFKMFLSTLPTSLPGYLVQQLLLRIWQASGVRFVLLFISTLPKISNNVLRR